MPGSCVDVVDAIMSHRSIRKYRSEPVNEEDLIIIVKAAIRAPTSWNLMPVSIIAVTDDATKRKLAEHVGGQQHVAEAPVFLVFAVDYAKVFEAAKSLGVEPSEPGLGHLLSAAINAGIMAAWATLAAEKMGYGATMIAVYGNPCAIAKELGLPRGVVPILGLTIGIPAESPEVRPRQPVGSVFSRETYTPAPSERADGVIRVYGDRARAIMERVVGVNGYFESVSSRIRDCLREQGFKL